MIDTHVHFDALAAQEGVIEAWKRARSVGVERALAVTIDPASWSATAKIAASLDGVSMAIGLHPQEIPAMSDDALDAALRDLPGAIDRYGAIAVGELGLDAPSGDHARQERAMIAQLEIARSQRLPISLHVLGAHARAIELLRRGGPLPAGGIAHGFSGSAEIALALIKLGLSVSFAGAVTRSNARKPLVAVRAVPDDFLLIETDAPFQPTGADARDRVFGSPEDLSAVVDAVARARGVDRGDIVALTTRNAQRVLALPAAQNAVALVPSLNEQTPDAGAPTARKIDVGSGAA
ncbi:MAG: TatD family hydrolase [Polyangiales bacterium]